MNKQLEKKLKNWHSLDASDKKELKQSLSSGCLLPGSAKLSLVSQAVEVGLIDSPKIQKVINQLYKTAGSERNASPKQAKKGKGLVGVAAPQIGINKRIILVDSEVNRTKKSLGSLSCFINPEIIWRSRETNEHTEGCYSTGPVRGIVRRPIAIKLRAWRPNGKKIERVFEGFTARILQHEIDHLDGICFPDRLSNAKKLHWVHGNEKNDHRENPKNWPRLCSRAQWEAIKSGKYTFDLQ